jgi:hypothetical protein
MWDTGCQKELASPGAVFAEAESRELATIWYLLQPTERKTSVAGWPPREQKSARISQGSGLNQRSGITRR